MKTILLVNLYYTYINAKNQNVEDHIKIKLKKYSLINSSCTLKLNTQFNDSKSLGIKVEACERLNDVMVANSVLLKKQLQQNTEIERNSD